MADVEANAPGETILTRDRALLQDTVREAGALAQSMFRTELKTWTKGASSPVSEADIAVNDLLEARLRGATPDYGWLSESADDAARLSRRLTGSSIPSTARATTSMATTIGASASRWSVIRRRCWLRCSRLSAASSSPRAAVAPRSTAQPCRLRPDPRSTSFPCRRPETDGRAAQQLGRRDQASSANRLARAAAVPGRPWRVGCGFCGGNSHDWDLAAADLIVQEADGRMSDLSGEPILYNRREVAHGVLVAAGRDRHAGIVAHFRNRPLA